MAYKDKEKKRERQAAWVAANREKLREYRAAWREENREKIRAYRDAWAAANPEKIRAYSAAYKAANGEKVRARQAAYRAANPESLMWRQAKCRAKAKNLPFTITPDDIVIPPTCPVLGILLQRNCGNPGPNSPSLDRIVPALGYVLENVLVISQRANTIKSNATPDEIARVAAFYQQVWNKGMEPKQSIEQKQSIKP